MYVIEDKEREYRCIEDLLDDIVDDKEVIEWIDELYPDCELPLVGNISLGSYLERNDVQTLRCIRIDDYIPSIAENVMDELSRYGEAEYNGYTIYEIE